MPIIEIQITDEGVTNEQKKALIAGATQLLVDVLNKDPHSTFVIITEINTDNWGFSGKQVSELRKNAKT